VHVYSPITGIMSLAILGALYALIEPGLHKGWLRTAVAVGHWAAHTLAVLLAMILFANLNLHLFNFQPEALNQIPLFAVEMVAVGYLLGGLIMGLHLIVSNRWFAMNRTLAMASHQVADYKNFLRMRIDEQGLVIYPVAVDKVPRQWHFNGDGAAGSPWFLPAEGEIEIRAVEPPIAVSVKR
jgi:hypothetical protein